MSFKKLEEFIKIAKDSGALELEYKDGDKKFAVSFKGEGVAPSYIAPAVQASAAPVATAAAAPSASDSGLLEITSPFVGTFYRAASPEADPYAKVGQRVSKGSTLCIVEAMKIMNEIESDFDGEIVEICVENENYVEFGQVLFRIKP